MTKSYLFLALFLTLVLAKNNCSAKALPNADKDHQDDSDENNPSLNCVLFGDRGCDITCVVASQAYGIKARGRCKEDRTCNCLVSGDLSFHQRFKKLFDADYVYRKINEDQNKEDEARRMFRFPFRTGEQFKELLKPIVTPYQFSKLNVRDDSMAAKFMDKNEGKIDEKAVKKYLSEEMGKLLKLNAYKTLLNTNYKRRFTKYLNDFGSELGTLYNVTLRVRQSKNAILEQFLREYLDKNELEDPPVDAIGNEDLAVTLITSIDNEIIKLYDEKRKAEKARNEAARVKEPVNRTA